MPVGVLWRSEHGKFFNCIPQRLLLRPAGFCTLRILWQYDQGHQRRQLHLLAGGTPAHHSRDSREPYRRPGQFLFDVSGESTVLVPITAPCSCFARHRSAREIPCPLSPSLGIMSRQVRELTQMSKHRLKRASLWPSSAHRGAEKAQ